jgi:hypothetical protein
MAAGSERGQRGAVTARIVAALLVAAVLDLQASAADIWVRAGADGDCSRDNPCGDLWRPLNRAARGDVIHVAEGIYHGRAGGGAFVVKVPRLTLVGGYSADFSVRDPFRYPSVLERAAEFSGDWTQVPEAIVAGQQGADHRGLVLDGFVLDGRKRNAYGADGSLDPRQSWNGPLIETLSPDLAVRNCTLVNPYGEGIASRFSGDNNEVSNSFVVNTFYAGVSTRLAKPGSVVRITGCTIAFTWAQPGRGGGSGVLVGREGATVIGRNVIAFTSGDDEDPGGGVSNPYGNDRTELVDNLFFLCQGGLYRYMDVDGRLRSVGDQAALDELALEPRELALAVAAGNRELDPRLRPPREVFEHFSNRVAASFGRQDRRRLDQLRAVLRLPPEAESGSTPSAWAVAYPREQMVPNLVARNDPHGVQTTGPFLDYCSEGPAAPAQLGLPAVH